MTKPIPVRAVNGDRNGLAYIGLARVEGGPGGPGIRRSDLRSGPEFGGCACVGESGPEDEMFDDDYDGMDDIPGGVPSGQDPTGLFAYPSDAGWLDRWAWESDQLTVDAEVVADGDVDALDDMNEPDEYMSMIAGTNQEASMNTPMHGDGEFGYGEQMQNFSRGGQNTVARRPTGNTQITRGLKRQTKGKWMKTVITAVTTDATVLPIAGAGTTLTQTLNLRPQFDFVSQDLTFQANAAFGGATPGGVVTNLVWIRITRIAFGDHTVFDNAVGAPAQIFSTTVGMGGASFLRGIIKGARIRGGLDILITVSWSVISAAGGVNDCQVTAVVVGLKPQTTC